MPTAREALDDATPRRASSGCGCRNRGPRRLCRARRHADFTESFEDGLGDWKTDRPSGLADGWHEYEFEWTTPELSTDTLYLAVGTAVIWEDDAAHYVDALSVSIEPR